ncbi:C39 family peptidase [Paenibacillus agilis]|uniref:Peptidase C39-like domain-containing protein n=1 Tax=Paenibacillus agilis TaxID=3020863 RepID=A0A559IGN8_9BACL|nr:C39 family peptidase [Paenibacillus agilis]TVX86794.1 hypothetical protein FPZ44_23010 [Paenibacillus agilis]
MSKQMVTKAAKVLTTAALMFTLLGPSTIFSAGTGDNPLFTPDKPTAAQKAAEAYKMQLVEEHKVKLAAKDASIVSPMKDTEKRTITVSAFKQETNYWCGPATVKQMLHSFNNSSNSQTYYAQKLGTTTDGTDFSLIDNVLNSHQSKHNYTYRDFAAHEYETWKSIVILTTDWGYPTALDLRITSKNMPLYTATVEGHILNTSGYDLVNANKKQIRLTDPFDQGQRGVTFGNVWHPFDGVWNANQDHFRKAVIW